MKIIFKILVCVFIPFSIPAISSVSITFENSNKFTDYELTGESRKKSLKILKNDFHKLFNLLAKNYIAEDDEMEISITNIDLAGTIRFNQSSAGQNVRVIKDNNFIRLHFNYRVRDNNGELLKEGQYKLKEITRSSNSKISNSRFGKIRHFVKPLKSWFSITFTE
ncbi:MAG: DUF3016 domain-containing protein [Kangiellaceae bacterium]|nr:DUF3016 domain-containing protein [Kangiellaceae bacterium]